MSHSRQVLQFPFFLFSVKIQEQAGLGIQTTIAILKLRGEALNGNLGLSLKDRKICFLFLFYDRTVLVG